MAAIEAEGIGTKAYAGREGLSVALLYYWRRQLKRTKAGGVIAGTGQRFVPVRVADAGLGSGCAVTVVPGLRLECRELPAPEWLVALAVALDGAH